MNARLYGEICNEQGNNKSFDLILDLDCTDERAIEAFIKGIAPQIGRPKVKERKFYIEKV